MNRSPENHNFNLENICYILNIFWNLGSALINFKENSTKYNVIRLFCINRILQVDESRTNNQDFIQVRDGGHRNCVLDNTKGFQPPYHLFDQNAQVSNTSGSVVGCQ